MTKKKMTEKQKKFCDEYIKTLDPIGSYLSVFKNCKSRENASKHASRMLARDYIQEYVRACLQEAHNDRVADIQEVLEYLTDVMRGITSSEELLVVGTGDGCSEVTKVQKKPSERERLRAAELLGKRFGLFSDKVQAEIVVPTFEGEDELEE